MKKSIAFVLLFLIVFSFSSCKEVSEEIMTQSNHQNEKNAAYSIISQSEAKKIMESETEYIILDAREQYEYNESHIPGAICIPHTEITSKAAEKLPDKDILILVYCRSGRRSKIAAQTLVDLGYTNVKEFGGITTWEYETVNENTTV